MMMMPADPMLPFAAAGAAVPVHGTMAHDTSRRITYETATKGRARNFLPTRNVDVTDQHAGEMCSAENPGVPVTDAARASKRDEIKKERLECQRFARGRLRLAISRMCFEVGLKTKDGNTVSDFGHVITAFGKNASPSHTQEDLMKIQLHINLKLKGDRVDIDIQQQYMGKNRIFYIGKDGVHGENDKGGCYSQNANYVKNDLLRQTRNASWKAFGWKVLIRNPNKNDVEMDKWDITDLGSDAILVRKRNSNGAALPVIDPPSLSVVEQLQSLEEQMKQMMERKRLLLLSSEGQSVDLDSHDPLLTSDDSKCCFLPVMLV